MKIDKGNPLHWLALLQFGACTLLACLLRPFVRSPRLPIVVLYGHKLGGNLLALHEQAQGDRRWHMVFLTMDAGYARELNASGVPACIATRMACALLLARADAVISDHGLHAMQWMPGRCWLRFYDVWHGIPFKGFDADDFRVQHRYDEAWVTSPLLRDLYVERFGFRPERVHVTGYARTDRLVRATVEDKQAIRRALPVPVPDDRRIVLFAPTWRQDAPGRSIWPFGASEHGFLAQLSELAAGRRAVVIVRTHLNSAVSLPKGIEGVVHLPYARYPDTERLLLASDVLVCDWSSIAFDYLVLERPTVFLDVEPPFSKGFSLGPEFRFGQVVSNEAALVRTIAQYIGDPHTFQEAHGSQLRGIRERVYGTMLDGRAARRCLDRLAARFD